MSKGKRVVCIEDEPEMIDLVKLILSRKGYQVVGAMGGREGLEAIQREQPDLVLLDLMMPDMDGFQVLAALHQDPATRNIPIIIVTAAELSPEQHARLLRQVVAVRQKGSLQAEELCDDVQRLLALARV